MPLLLSDQDLTEITNISSQQFRVAEHNILLNWIQQKLRMQGAAAQRMPEPPAPPKEAAKTNDNAAVETPP